LDLQVFEELKNYQLVVTEYYDLVDSLDFESYKERKAKLTFDEEEENIWRLVEVQVDGV
jgi:hypothetical protein